MPTTVKDAETILATSADLEIYSRLSPKTRDVDFCEYLKRVRKSKATEVIADLSGVIFPSIVLTNVDLGNIIAGKLNGKYTKFQKCDLEGAKFHSKASMKGLEFTECTMSRASFIADLDGVNFGAGSDISYLNLKEAYNIDKCIISTEIPCSNIELGFPDTETFKKHMESKLTEQQKHQDHTKYPTSHRREGIPEAPDVQIPDMSESPKGFQFGIPALAGNMFRAFTSVVSSVGTTAGSAINAGWNVATTNITLGAPKPVDPVQLHQTSIEKILNHGPKYSSTIKYIDPSNIQHVTQQDVIDWVETNNVDGIQKLSLNEHFRMQYDNDNIVPHLMNLDFKGVDFSGLEFGDVVLSGCDFTDTKFNKCDLNSISARDCKFIGAEITETTANKADLTRCLFNGAKIDKASFIGAKLIDTVLSPGYLPTQISNSKFDNSDMRSSNADSAKITDTTFNNANMEKLKGDSLMLSGVTGEHSNLSGADLPNLAARKTEFTKSILDNVNAEGAALDGFTLTDTSAQGINLNKSNQKNVTYDRSNLSNGTANNSQFRNVKAENSKLIKFQAQQLNVKEKSYKPYLATIQEDDEVDQEARAGLSDLELKTPEEIGEQEPTSYNAQTSDTVITALETNALKPTQGLTIANSDARGIDLSGGHLKNFTLSHVNMQLAKMQNMVIENAKIDHTNMHGTSLAKSKMINSTLSDTDLTAANMEGIKVSGGKWQKVDISDTNITNGQLGTMNANLDIQDVRGNDVTNLANTTTHAIDTSAVGQEARIEIKDIDGKVTEQTPTAIATKCTRQEEIAGNLATNIGNVAATKFRAGVNMASNSVEAMVVAAKNKKRSRMGLAVGILGGVIAGGIVAGIAASTFGLGLIPLGIVAAATIGGGAIGGGIAGTLLQNTSKGRSLLAIATAGVAATVIGPVGLIAAPAIALYQTLTNRNSSVRDTFGSVLKTLVANPLKKIASFVAYIAPSEAEMIDAQQMLDSRVEVKNKTEEERAVLESQNVPNPHSQATAVAEQQTSNDQHLASTKDQDKSKTKGIKSPVPTQQAHAQAANNPQPNKTQQKTGWVSRVAQAANSVAKKITHKKNTSHTETLQTQRADTTQVSTGAAK